MTTMCDKKLAQMVGQCSILAQNGRKLVPVLWHPTLPSDQLRPKGHYVRFIVTDLGKTIGVNKRLVWTIDARPCFEPTSIHLGYVSVSLNAFRWWQHNFFALFPSTLGLHPKLGYSAVILKNRLIRNQSLAQTEPHELVRHTNSIYWP